MLKLKKIAVTGGVSCGKTLFCHYLQELGAYVVSADEIVHQLLNPRTDLGKSVVQLLGADILAGSTLDRKKIANKVFQQPELLKSLESLLHPEVLKEIERQYLSACQDGSVSAFVAEVPLLFEIGADNAFDVTVAVLANEEQCSERFRTSGAGGKNDYDLRMSRQLDPRQKAQRANVIIPNTGNKEELRQRAEQFYQNLLTH